MILTNDLIVLGMSRRGGWSEEQFALLGIKWPPRRGWKYRVIGLDYPKETIDQFLALKDKHLEAQL